MNKSSPEQVRRNSCSVEHFFSSHSLKNFIKYLMTSRIKIYQNNSQKFYQNLFEKV